MMATYDVHCIWVCDLHVLVVTLMVVVEKPRATIHACKARMRPNEPDDISSYHSHLKQKFKVTNLTGKGMWWPSIFCRLHDTSVVGYNIWRNSQTYISSALLDSNICWTVWSAATQLELLKLATGLNIHRYFSFTSYLRWPEPSITKEHLNVWEMRDNRSWSVDIVNLH